MESGGAPFFGKPLNGPALDYEVEQTWAHRSVEQVADEVFDAASRVI